jgi:integrase
VRITNFPFGIEAPRRVRIYHRLDHYVLQWWDRGARRTLSDRVNGDLVAAIARARQIDERLDHFKSSGLGHRKIGHQALVDQYLADLRRRADAGEIGPRTVERYSSALKHYLTFVGQPEVQRQVPHAGGVNREFALAFMAYLNAAEVLPNGHPNSRPQAMRSQAYVLDVVRSVFAWAAAPDRGKLLPEGFRNPFVGRGHGRRGASIAQVGEPDITTAMAVGFLKACDAYQLRLFAPLALYGLRAAEPCMLFHEHLGQDWLSVVCLPDLAYETKGRRDKLLPVVPGLLALFEPSPGLTATGVLYQRRRVLSGAEAAPLLGASLRGLAREFQRRCAASAIRTIADRRGVRDDVLHDAGAITYDHIVGEFGKIAGKLGWPQSATIKDFRHLFATGLENAGMPEHYRKFLLGQSPGRAAIVTYTHLNAITQHFEEAVMRQFQPVVEAVMQRSAELR